MAGKHRKPARRAHPRRWLPALTAAAVSATSVSTALVTGATASVGALPVKLTALITPADSTAPTSANSSYYGQDWTGKYGQPQVVPFFLGPQGIVNAVDQNSSDPTGIVVLSSGWGAGQTSTALATMQANNDPAMNNVKLVVLDNDTNRAGGGFWTTYWMLAPFLLTSAAPTPSDTAVPVVDTAYEYNVNSDAPSYPIDPFAVANSLMTYVLDYGAQSTAPIPPQVLQPVAPDAQHYHYVVAADGTVAQTIPVNGNITYVTFESNGLPLVEPLRVVPGGNVVADALQPTLTVLVDWGYQDDSPIPENPAVTRPVGLLPPASQDVAVAQQLPGALQRGVQAAQNDLSSPNTLVTSPLSSVSHAMLPTASSALPGQSDAVTNVANTLRSPSAPKSPSTNVFDIRGANTVNKARFGPTDTTSRFSGSKGSR